MGGLNLPPGVDATLVGQMADEVKQAAELQAGLRCGGCKQRITEGTEFLNVQATTDGEKNEVRIRRTFACHRPDCRYWEIAADASLAARPVIWAFFDEKPDAPLPQKPPLAG